MTICSQPHQQHHEHQQGPGRGREPVPHGDDVDHLVNGHLHHPHGDHCDDHGLLTQA
ncbi:MAG: hypothetical protein QM740_21125 [Acidovorax sp.]